MVCDLWLRKQFQGRVHPQFSCLKVFQRFVYGSKNAAEQTRRTKQNGNEKSTTSLYNPLSRCVNKFSNVVVRTECSTS